MPICSKGIRFTWFNEKIYNNINYYIIYIILKNIDGEIASIKLVMIL